MIEGMLTEQPGRDELPSQSNPQAQIAIASITPQIKYAGFWIRTAAALIDFVVLLALSISIFFGFATAFPFVPDFIVGLVVLLILYLYPVFMVGRYQATIGKMLMGVRVERVNGERVGFGRAILREIVGKFISNLILNIGFLMVAWTKKKQGLHDKIASTVVVEKNPSKSRSVLTWIVIGIVSGSFLLVTIIGLVAIIFSSWNSARAKANDAAIKGELSMIAVQAEIFYGLDNSYGIASSCSDDMFASEAIAPSISIIDEKSGETAICESNGRSYMAAARISDGRWWCVDSFGFSEIIEFLPGSKAYACTAENAAISGSAREGFVLENTQSCIDTYYDDRKSKKAASKQRVETYCSCVINTVADTMTNSELDELSGGIPVSEDLNTRINSAAQACGGVPE